jgi:proteasome accessory factor C
VYRDLKAMTAAGLPFIKERVGGEMRYALDESFPGLRPEEAQRRALEWARIALRPLRGTRAYAALEALLDGDLRGEAAAVEGAEAPAAEPHVLRAIEEALGQRRLRLRYRDRAGNSTRRDVEPFALRFSGRHLYLVAHCLKADELRTFKVVRIQHARALPEPIRQPAEDLRSAFEGSVTAFTGEPMDVAIRLAPSVAAIAGEYPLVAQQTVESEEDGAVIVRARVAGYLETVRWVLGWGAAAVALSPSVLREAVKSELVGALGRYGPGVKRVVPGRVGRVPASEKDRR